jgi:predicted ribosomally synthesized peptide with SipW-like signal peptide
MKVKIIITSILIIVFSILAFGLLGSGAWFSDSASVSGSISSGNFDLQASGGPFSISKVEPGAGYQSVGDFCLRNSGDYNMKFRGYIKDLDDPGNLRDYLLLRIEMKPFNEEDQNNYGPADGKLLVTDIPFASLMAWNDVLALYPGGPGDPIPFAPGSKVCYTISTRLSGTAGNDQIQKSLIAQLYIDATQWISTAW